MVGGLGVPGGGAGVQFAMLMVLDDVLKLVGHLGTVGSARDSVVTWHDKERSKEQQLSLANNKQPLSHAGESVDMLMTNTLRNLLFRFKWCN